MELKNYSDEQLLKELKSRGFITDLILSTKDVDIAIDELEGDLLEEIKEKITFEKKLEILNTINTDDIGDAILDDIKNCIWEEFEN
jgi:hypothetical protein